MGERLHAWRSKAPQVNAQAKRDMACPSQMPITTIACLLLQEFQALLQSVRHTSLYLVARPGPFCFTLCADGSEDKYKVLLGAQVTCSCRCECAALCWGMLAASLIERGPAVDTAQLLCMLLCMWTCRPIDCKPRVC